MVEEPPTRGWGSQRVIEGDLLLPLPPSHPDGSWGGAGRGGKRGFKVTEVGEGLVCSGRSKEAYTARVEAERGKVASDEVREHGGHGGGV